MARGRHCEGIELVSRYASRARVLTRVRTTLPPYRERPYPEYSKYSLVGSGHALRGLPSLRGFSNSFPGFFPYWDFAIPYPGKGKGNPLPFLPCLPG